jgi:hypothetical protein
MLPVGLAAATTIVDEDIDGGPLGDAVDGSGCGHHLVSEDFDGRPLWGAAGGSDSGHHLVEEDINGAPLGVLPVGPVVTTT